jgi:transcriptional regulator with XRE-family HTH domain
MSTPTFAIDLREWGNRIRQRREELGLTQGELAERIEQFNSGLRCEQPMVSRWEAGKKPIGDDYRWALAQVLDDDIRRLFPYPGEP